MPIAIAAAEANRLDATALHWAVHRESNLEAVQFILKLGCAIDATNDAGLTVRSKVGLWSLASYCHGPLQALHFSVLWKQYGLTALLMDKGSDPTIQEIEEYNTAPHFLSPSLLGG